jgi:hypothetical protein
MTLSWRDGEDPSSKNKDLRNAKIERTLLLSNLGNSDNVDDISNLLKYMGDTSKFYETLVIPHNIVLPKPQLNEFIKKKERGEKLSDDILYHIQKGGKKHSKSSKRSVKKSTKRSVKKSTKRSAKKSTKRSVKKSTKRVPKKSVKRSLKKSAKHSAKKSAKLSAKKSAKRSAKKSTKRSAKRSAKRSVKKSAVPKKSTKRSVKKSVKRSTVKRKSSSAIQRTIKSKKIEVYRGSVKITDGFVNVSDGYIYISFKTGSTYWILRKMLASERPKLSVNDNKKQFKINNYRIVYSSNADYQKAKTHIINYLK